MNAAAANQNGRHVAKNPELHRYELRMDGRVLGFAAYRERSDGVIVFTHTEIDEAYEGHGLGGRLARGALDDVHASGGSVVPRCPFIKGYIERHPEFQDLVAEPGGE
jgi:predicted GNAT family acetyltransferase